MVALSKWRQYLMGAWNKFEVWSDHLNLAYFWVSQKLNRCQACWFTELQEFNFKLKHMPGKENTHVDLLSCMSEGEVRIRDNKDLTLLPEGYFKWLEEVDNQTSANTLLPESMFVRELNMVNVSSAILDEIQKDNSDKELTCGGLQHRKDYQPWDGLWLHQNWVYVPPISDLHECILYNHHDTPLCGHPRKQKTEELVLWSYWWPKIRHDVKWYVEGCDFCQKIKIDHQKQHGHMHPNEAPDRVWKTISADIIGPLPKSGEFNAILMVINRLSKMVHAIPTNTMVTADQMAHLYQKHVWKHHRILENVRGWIVTEQRTGSE